MEWGGFILTCMHVVSEQGQGNSFFQEKRGSICRLTEEGLSLLPIALFIGAAGVCQGMN